MRTGDTAPTALHRSVTGCDLRVVSPEEAEYAALSAEDLGNGARIHELEHAVARGGGQHTVRTQPQVQVLPPQQLVHQRDDLTTSMKSIKLIQIHKLCV